MQLNITSTALHVKYNQTREKGFIDGHKAFIKGDPMTGLGVGEIMSVDA